MGMTEVIVSFGCTALGVFALWLWAGAREFDFQHVREVLGSVGVPHEWVPFVQLMVVLTVGTVLAAVLVKPQTCEQAIAAGLAWTGFIPRKPSGSRHD